VGWGHVDNPSTTHTLSMRLVACDQPLSDALVAAVGVSYFGKTYARTDASGKCTIAVNPGSQVRIEVQLAQPAATPMLCDDREWSGPSPPPMPRVTVVGSQYTGPAGKASALGTIEVAQMTEELVTPP